MSIAPMIVSFVAGLQIPPATGRPSSTNPIDAQNSGMPCTNSRVPSSGSTTHTLLLLRRDISSALSSESHPSPSRNRFWRNITSMARSASVTGSCPILYSVSIAPGVRRANTARAASRAAEMRSRISAYAEELMFMNLSLEELGPQHAGSCYQQQRAEKAAQPQHRKPGGDVGSDQSARNRADQKRNHKSRIDIPQPEVHESGYTREHNRVHNVGTDVNFRREAVEQKQQHHDDAAGTDRCHTN